MAFQSKSEQREAGSTDYSGSERVLNSDSVKEQSMGSKGPDKIWGNVQSGSTKKVVGKVSDRNGDARLTGKMSGSGFSATKKGK